MNRKQWRVGSALLVAVLTATSSVALAQNATLTVKVNWEGKPYRAKHMKNMNKECVGFHNGKAPRKEAIKTNENGTLQNVFVYIKNPPRGDYKVPTELVRLDQTGCLYVPHVFGIRVGQTLEIHNGDPTAHNIHFTPRKNKEFNKSQPKKDLIEKMTFKRAEIMVPVKCDVHPWMSAFVGVMDHPFFGTTREDGVVTMKDLPPGTYELVAWHEKLGRKTQEVTVSPGAATNVEFSFSRADKKKRR